MSNRHRGKASRHYPYAYAVLFLIVLVVMWSTSGSGDGAKHHEINRECGTGLDRHC
ncbi:MULTISPECIES: hypothetical protein [Streptomyces]|uniref:hypothetical protein n=1 Tax=Streptomyces TaxID=1883 RepID=UPI000F42E1B2|nr:hypothetical protein [Streptomyces sp. ADI95-16]AYV25520.1 hypothetical protein EES41_02080 [Streptomyces sp. ADI95-16]